MGVGNTGFETFPNLHFSRVEIRKRFLVLAFFEIERQKWCEYDDSEKHEASINL